MPTFPDTKQKHGFQRETRKTSLMQGSERWAHLLYVDGHVWHRLARVEQHECALGKQSHKGLLTLVKGRVDFRQGVLDGIAHETPLESIQWCAYLVIGCVDVRKEVFDGIAPRAPWNQSNNGVFTLSHGEC